MYDEQPARKIAFRPPLGRKHPDDEIAERALSILRWKIRYNSILVKAEKGHVTLSGEVNWYSDREAAEHTVSKLSGVVGVSNLITTKGLRPHFKRACKMPSHQAQCEP
jgi:osmotically-inducible protein OsmY